MENYVIAKVESNGKETENFIDKGSIFKILPKSLTKTLNLVPLTILTTKYHDLKKRSQVRKSRNPRMWNKYV